MAKPVKKQTTRRPNPPVDPTARARLRELVEQLRKLESAASAAGAEVKWATVDGDIADWVAKALTKYLNGEAATLDQAFGLNPSRGAQKLLEEHKEIARQIFEAKNKGKSWLEIASELPTQGMNVSDERTLRRIYDSCLPGLMFDEIMAGLEKRGHEARSCQEAVGRRKNEKERE